MEKIKTGLWYREFTDNEGNQKFNYSGSITIGEQKYYLNLYKNEKTKDSQPDFQLYLAKAQPKQDNLVEISTDLSAVTGFAQIEEDIPF